MTIIINATMEIDPAHAERIVLDAKDLIEASLAEPGCEAYSWALDPLHPGRVEVFERWRDEASLANHFTLPNYTVMRTHLRSAGPIKSTSRKYRVAHDEPVYDDSGTPRADFFTAA
ncbi:putative quinol monooxygenase [Sphingomonas profundi]|uniref:putative quinol monooxygenase n=1 Tax=Alterirhizorhabdus profundi TaxID=2681549 RepID=UPI0012E75533|nr:putative quinol monooxygenase [Sphingomonas profundi]